MWPLKEGLQCNAWRVVGFGIYHLPAGTWVVWQCRDTNSVVYIDRECLQVYAPRLRLCDKLMAVK